MVPFLMKKPLRISSVTGSNIISSEAKGPQKCIKKAVFFMANRIRNVSLNFRITEKGENN